jgi:hypothetical protein
MTALVEAFVTREKELLDPIERVSFVAAMAERLALDAATGRARSPSRRASSASARNVRTVGRRAQCPRSKFTPRSRGRHSATAASARPAVPVTQSRKDPCEGEHAPRGVTSVGAGIPRATCGD